MPLPLKSREWWSLYAVFWTFLVALPLIPLVLEYVFVLFGVKGNVLFGPLLVPLSFYFFPVALVFGEPHFVIGIGVGPQTFIGVMLAAIFYSFIALVPTVVYGRNAEKISTYKLKKAALFMGALFLVIVSWICFVQLQTEEQAEILIYEMGLTQEKAEMLKSSSSSRSLSWNIGMWTSLLGSIVLWVLWYRQKARILQQSIKHNE